MTDLQATAHCLGQCFRGVGFDFGHPGIAEQNDIQLIDTIQRVTDE